MVFRQVRKLNPSNFLSRLASWPTPYVGSPTFVPTGKTVLGAIPIPVGTAPAVLTPSGSPNNRSPGVALTSTASGTSPAPLWYYSEFPYTTWHTTASFAFLATPAAGNTATLTPVDQFDSGNYRFRCVWTNAFGDTSADVSDYYSVAMSSGGG